MKLKYSFVRRNGLALLALVLPAFSQTLHASPIQWSNSGTDFNAAASWIGDVSPGAADLATFSGAPLTNPVLSAPSTVAGLVFADAEASGYGLSGSTLTLGVSGIDASALSSGTNSISSNLTLANGGQIWDVGTGATLALSTGSFSRSIGSTLNLQGAGTVSAAMTGLANVNGILGPWASVGSGSTTRYATLSSGNITSFTTATAAAAFGWPSSNNNTFNYDVAAVQGSLGVGRQGNTARYTGVAGIQNWGNNNTTTVTLNGLLNVGSGTLTFSEAGGTSQGQLGVGTNNGNTLVLSAANADITIKIPIVNTGANAGSLVVTGPNTVSIDSAGGVSTYTGSTTLASGTLLVNGVGNINSTSGITINGIGAKYIHTSTVASTRAINLLNGSLDGTGSLGATTLASDSQNTIANGNGGTAALSFESLSFGGAASVIANRGVATPLVVTGALTTTPANGKVAIQAAGLLANGMVRLISFGSFTGSIADFEISTPDLGARQVATPTLDGNHVALNISGETLIWTGANDGSWTTTISGDHAGPNNWVTGQSKAPTNFWQADNVAFNDSYPQGESNISIAESNVVINDSVNPASTSFNNNLVDYTIDSYGDGIASGSLTKTGTGTLTILGTNTYTGATTLEGGVIRLGDGSIDGTIANTSTVTNHGTLAYQVVGARTAPYPVTGSGNVTKNGAGTLTITGNGSYSGGTILSEGSITLAGAGNPGSGEIQLADGTMLNINKTQTLSNVVSGEGDITTTGTTTVNGDFSAFSGTYTHNSSTASTAFNTSSSTSKNAVYHIATAQGSAQGLIAGGVGDYTLEMGALTGITGSLIRGGLTVSGTTLLKVGNLNLDSTFAGSITNGTTKILGLTKVGTGVLTLSGASSYSGPTLVSAGTLQVTGNLAAASSVTVAAGATLSGTGTLAGTLSSEGTVAPGITTGTLSTGPANLTGTLAIEIDGAAHDRLVSTGAINLGAANLSITLLSGGFTEASYVIAEGTEFIGSLANVPAGYTVSTVAGGAGQQLILSLENASAYDSWASAQGLTAANSAANADPDHDGVGNALEFVLGSNPLISDASRLPQVSVTASEMIFSFTREDASEAELALEFQHSANLSTWTSIQIGADNASSAPGVSIIENDANPDQVTITLPKGTEAKLFGRLQAVK